MKRVLLAFVLALVPALASAQSPSPYTALPTQPLAPAIVVFPGSANQVLAVDGTAAAPSMTFASQPDLGFYKLSSTSIGFTSAGSAIGFMNSGGIAFTSTGAGLYLGPGQDTILQRGGAAGKVTLVGTTPMLLLGGTTSSFVAVKQSGTTLQVRLADDSVGAGLQAANLQMSSVLISGTAPTLGTCTGFGTSPAMGTTNGAASFLVTAGTAPPAGGTCTINLPPAATGWNCSGEFRTSTATMKETSTTTTTAVLTVAGTPTAGETAQLRCVGY